MKTEHATQNKSQAKPKFTILGNSRFRIDGHADAVVVAKLIQKRKARQSVTTHERVARMRKRLDQLRPSIPTAIIHSFIV